jgi:hypothetical protein
VLTTVFYRVLTATGRDYSAAVFDTVLCTCGLMTVALVMAIAELIRRRSRGLDRSAPAPGPEHHV